jgi:hypothetical protein
MGSLGRQTALGELHTAVKRACHGAALTASPC